MSYNSVMLFAFVRPFLQAVLVVVLSVLPAWGFTARFKGDALTRLSMTVLASLTFLYLIEFGAYLLSLPQIVPLLFFTVASIASILLSRRSLPPPDGMLTWLALTFWMVGLQGLIVVYGATAWFGDWYEHYERSLFFVEQAPATTRFLLNTWSLPARGPLFNAAAGFMMNFLGKDFSTFQVIATTLNTLAVLSLALLLRDLSGLGQRTALRFGMLLCALAPWAVSQETFTWTKFAALAFLLQGIHLYLRGLKANNPSLTAASFVVFAAGILVHYLNLVFVIFFGLHFVYITAIRKWGWKRLLVSTGVSALLLATWFVYVFAIFGLKESFTANSTFGDFYSKVHPSTGKPAWSQVFANNMVATIIPYSFRHRFPDNLGKAPVVEQADPRLGANHLPPAGTSNRGGELLCDLANHPSSLLGSLGLAGIAALLLAARHHKSIRSEQRETGKVFWALFFLIGVPANIFLQRDFTPEGVAHLNLQPYICLAILFAVRVVKDRSTSLKAALIGLLVVESLFVSGALIFLESRPVSIFLQNGKVLAEGIVSLNKIYISNYVYKLQMQAVFLSDLLQGAKSYFLVVALALAAGTAMLGWKPTSSKT